MPEGRYKKLLSNTLIYGIGTFASKLLVFFLTRLYTECLTTEQYGMAELITNAANLLIPLAAAGICDAIFRFTLDSREDKRTVFRTGCIVLGLSGLAFALLSPLITLSNEFRGYAWVIAAYVLAANFHSAAANYVRAVDRSKLFALQGIFNTVLTICLNLLFLVVLPKSSFLNGVYGYVLSIVIADFITGAFLVIYAGLWREFRVGVFDRGLARRMLKYSLPLIPTAVFWWITNVSDRYMVTLFCGKSVNGLYSAAYKIPTMLILVTGVFSEAWQFSAVKEDDPKERSRFYTSVFGYFQAVIFVGAALIIAFTKIFSALLYAEDFQAAWEFIPILVISSVFSAFVNFLASVYMVKKSTVKSFLTAMLGAAVNILLNFLLIPQGLNVFGLYIRCAGLGGSGAAIATAVSYLAVFIVRAIDTRSLLKFDMRIARLTLNTVLIVGQATALMLVESLPVMIISQALFVITTLGVNIKPLKAAVFGVVRNFLRKKA